MAAARFWGRALGRRLEEARDAFLARLLRSKRMRRAYLRDLSSLGHRVYCRFADHVLLVDGRELIGRHVVVNGNWSRALTDDAIRLSRAARPRGDVFLEIGANIGTQTIYAHLSRRFRRFVCVEPNPAAVEMLRFNVAANGIADRATIVGMGAGDRPGNLELSLFDGNLGRSSFETLPAEPAAGSIAVEVDTIDAILARAGMAPPEVGMAWIDVEGFEDRVWRGMSALLGERPPVMMEFSPEQHDGERTRAFVADIGRFYETCTVFGGGRRTTMPVRDLLSIRRQVDVLLLPEKPGKVPAARPA